MPGHRNHAPRVGGVPVHSLFVLYPLYIVSMEYNHGVLPEKKALAAGIRAFSHVEVGSFLRSHRLYLKETGDCLATFMNPEGALLTLPTADRGLKWVRSNGRKNPPGQDLLTG